MSHLRWGNRLRLDHLRWGRRLRHGEMGAQAARLAMLIAISAVAAAMLLPLTAQAADAHSVLAAPRQRIESADFRASGHLVWVQANGIRVSVPVTIKAHWFPGVLRVLLEIGSVSKTGVDSLVSAQLPANILLEMRPKGANMVKIAHHGDANPVILPFDKWSDGPLGAGFSYEDFLEAQYFWEGQTELEKTKFGARDCNVVRSVPGATDKTHYVEVKSWLDQDIGFPVYVEKTLKDGKVKEFTYYGLRKEGGVWSAHQVEAKTRGQAGSTLLIIDRGTPQANLSLKDFSPAQLTHFQDGK